MCEEWSPIERDASSTPDERVSDRSLDESDRQRPPALAVLDRIGDPVYAFDDDLNVTYANDAARALFGLAAGCARPNDATRGGCSPPSLFDEAHHRALERERRSPLTVDRYHEASDSWLEARLWPSATGVTVEVRDVTERNDRERRVAEDDTLRVIFEAAHDAIVLGDHRSITEANPAACELFGLERSELRGRSFVEFVADDECDIREEWRDFLETGRRRDIRRLALADGTERVVEYNAVANVVPGTHLAVLRDVTDARERERELEEQRQRLAALNHVNGVVREINAAIVNGSTRDDLETVACQTLADSPSYEFAFVADVDSNVVTTRVEAGVDGYLESIPLSIDADDPSGRGPIGRAIRTLEVQVTNDVLEDPTFRPWHDDARERGYASAAVIPIVHGGVLYGVLGVTSARPNAFSDEERAVVSQLGELLGHAIAAQERRRVLLGETVIELELVIDDATAMFDGPSMADRIVQFDRVVRIGDDQYLEYGSTSPETYPEVEELVDCVPHWDDVTVLEESGDQLTFELEITAPPMFSVIEAYGGYVDAAAIHDGDYITTILLPPGTDVRALVAEIESVYPGTRTLARRQRNLTRESIAKLVDRLTADLTPRQRTALEMAYATGYFEWPRTTSGEEVAETLDVTPATFHEHLRTAQRKLLDALFDEGERLEE
ncbi:bacterio-opsin activator domain-containing protein [Natrarchaeobaculum aegyptiacum]|uniref:PAS sensor protein n=1 Tax=Natrarchaeobaculum aegyptiacum TaxID=745377 RepID=A0A2Z2HXG6_9EURY|nr:bacterio-opsin activator domain-containing protein [Natrarchaeobaculum aegyptiacum]ARS90357.1 PAS sensor protein [Natrarchaeobaculum aegyptiacum]